MRPGLTRELEDPVCGEGADGQVVVAGPAEAAQVGAAADDFDQEARAELGIGREDARRWRIETLGTFYRGLLHDGRRAGAWLRLEGGDRVVGVVADVVERGHIEPPL